MFQSIERYFISTSKIRLMEIKLQLQTIRKYNLNVLDYFEKMKRVFDEFF